MKNSKKFICLPLLVIFASCNAQNKENKNEMKQENIVNEQVSEKQLKNFELNDFKRTDTDGDFRMYELNEKCIVFNKVLNEEPLKISIHKNYNFSEYLPKINEYIKWINSNDLRRKLENSFAETMEVEIIETWYDNIEAYKASITVEDDGVMYALISCRDSNWEQGILTFDLWLKEKEINSIMNPVLHRE